MKLLFLLHFLKVNLTSFPPKYFFQKNNIEKFKRSPTVCFLTRRLCFEKKMIQQLAIENRSIIPRSDVPFGELRFKLYF